MFIIIIIYFYYYYLLVFFIKFINIFQIYLQKNIKKKYQSLMEKYKFDKLEKKIKEGTWTEQLKLKNIFFFSFVESYIKIIRKEFIKLQNNNNNNNTGNNSLNNSLNNSANNSLNNILVKSSSGGHSFFGSFLNNNNNNHLSIINNNNNNNINESFFITNDPFDWLFFFF